MKNKGADYSMDTSGWGKTNDDVLTFSEEVETIDELISGLMKIWIAAGVLYTIIVFLITIGFLLSV